MHRRNVWQVISYFENRAKGDPDLWSYFLGYICHYALDTTVHPLVFASAKKESLQSGEHEGAVHVRIEAEYDVWILHQRGRDISTYDVHEYLKIDEPSKAKLASMYQDMLRDIFHVQLAYHDVKGAITDCYTYTKLLRPRSGLKMDLVRKAEDLMHMPHAISGMMLNRKNTATALNMDQEEYELPARDGEKDHRSFPQLYGDASILALQLMKERKAEDFIYDFLGKPVITDEKRM